MQTWFSSEYINHPITKQITEALSQPTEEGECIAKENTLWCERCGGMFTNHNTEAHDLLAGIQKL